jgi:hypothetical protein
MEKNDMLECRIYNAACRVTSACRLIGAALMVLAGIGCIIVSIMRPPAPLVFLSISWVGIVTNSPLQFVLGVFGVFLVIALASMVISDFFETRCKKITKSIDDKITDERKDAAEQVMKNPQWTPRWRDHRIVNTLAYKRRKYR